MSETLRRDAGGQAQAELRKLFRGVGGNSTIIVPLNSSARSNGGTQPKFICVHPLSGTTSEFKALAEAVGPEISFFGIQAPGKMMQDSEFARSIRSIAEPYVKAAIQLQPEDTPFFLGGYSAGVSIAFEMAQQLTAHGRKVALLVAIDEAPRNTGGGMSRWNPLYFWQLARNLPRWTYHEVILKKTSPRILVKRVSDKIVISSKQAIAGVRSDARQQNEIGYVMDTSSYPPHHRSFMAAFFNAAESYEPRRYSGPVAIYESTVQSVFRLKQLKAAWRAIAPNSEIALSLVGTHKTILETPNVKLLAKDLRGRIFKLFL